MATTSQELNINHTYAKESEDVGEEIEGLLVTGFLYNVLIDTINQLHTSSFHNKWKRKKRLLEDFFLSLCFSWWNQTLNLLDFVYTDAAYPNSLVCCLIFLSLLLKMWSLMAEAHTCCTVH